MGFPDSSPAAPLLPDLLSASAGRPMRALLLELAPPEVLSELRAREPRKVRDALLELLEHILTKIEPTTVMAPAPPPPPSSVAPSEPSFDPWRADQAVPTPSP